MQVRDVVHSKIVWNKSQPLEGFKGRLKTLPKPCMLLCAGPKEDKVTIQLQSPKTHTCSVMAPEKLKP